MNLLLAKLLSKSPAWPSVVAATLAVASLTIAQPAAAQDEDSPGGDSAALTDTISTPTPEEQKALPRVELSSQIVYQVLAAEIALQRDQPAPAYQTYLALARDTHDPRFAQRATEIALLAQSPVDALNAARLWQQFAPASDRAAQIDASLLVLSGKPDEAQPLLERQLAKIPAENRGNAVIGLQLLLARGPDHAGGLRTLQDLLKNDMDRPEANFAIARQKALAGDRPGARQSLETALKQKPDFLPAVLLLAQLGPDERSEAIQLLTQYVQKNPKARDARLSLAQIYLASDRLDDAKAEFVRLAKDDRHDLLPMMALALIDVQQRNLPSAQQHLLEYVAEAQKHPNADPGQAYIYLAQISLEQKDDQAATQWLDKIPQDSAQYLPGQITRAQIVARGGKIDDARRMLASLKPIEPREQALVARTDGAILFDAKRYDEAESRLAEATQAFPSDPDLVYDYAMAAERNGHYDVMEVQLRNLIKLQPDNPQAYNALGYSLADRNQRLDEANKLIQKASSLAPNDAFIMDSVGWVEYRLGDKANAARVLRRAYDLQPNAEIGAHLGEVLWESGEQDQARAAWREARKLEPSNDTLIKTLKRFQVNDF
jgi:Flp pilus assembly protein TadD